MLMRILIAVFCGIAWCGLALVLGLNGVWLSSEIAEGDDQVFTRWATDRLETDNAGNSAFALIDDGVVVAEHLQGDGIDRNTLFPTASMSKFITALAVLRLAETGHLDLDAPVGKYLTEWQFAPTEFDLEAVTIRRLLSHTAGLTDGLGFGDYEAHETLPSVVEELSNPRASSGEQTAIAVGVEPGSEFIYSGGGYLVLELVIEEVTGQPFAAFVQEKILVPWQLERTTYSFLGTALNVTPSYDRDGTIAPHYRYASNAATGFATSIGDLSRLATNLLTEESGVLTNQSVTQLREPHGYAMGAAIWGLGAMLYAPTGTNDYVFGHDGGNDPAINTTLRLNAQTGDGLVVLVSGHPTLATNIGSEWVLWQTGTPDFLDMGRALGSALMPMGIGLLLLTILAIVWIRRPARDR